MSVRRKTCFCHTCGKAYHYLGINRHRAMHRERGEMCKITYTYGDTYTFDFRRHLTPLALDGATAPMTSGSSPADVLAGDGNLPEPPRQ